MNYANKLLLIAILTWGAGILFIEVAHSEESISILTKSHHVNAPDCIKYGTDNEPCTWNELNIGLSYNVDMNDTKGIVPYYVAGMYYNSFNRLSTHIGIGYRFKYGGVALSALTGYPMSPVLPSLVPYFEIPVIKRVKAQLLMPYMPGGVQVLALQVKVVL